MTPQELYKILDDAGLDYEVVEVFEGARWIRFIVDEEETNQLSIIRVYICGTLRPFAERL